MPRRYIPGSFFMKQKINVVIHKTGSNNGFILECTGETNAGKAQFSPRDLEGYLNMKKAFTPMSAEGYKLLKDETEPNTFHVSEDGGKTFTLSLEWVEVHNLETPVSNDDLKDVFN